MHARTTKGRIDADEVVRFPSDVVDLMGHSRIDRTTAECALTRRCLPASKPGGTPAYGIWPSVDADEGVLPGPACRTTDEHGGENAEWQRRHVRKLHADVSEEQHQQPCRREREQRKGHCEDHYGLEKVTHHLLLFVTNRC